MLIRLALLATVGLWLSAVSLHEAHASDWNRIAAARYLDARMESWWMNAKSLRTGAEETKCLSCHTTLPYMWARQSLRRAQGEASPTPHEQRVLESVYRRVEYRSSDQPYYDHAEDKKTESRGVEAVINAVILTSRDLETPSAKHDRATAAAMSRLWQFQRADGAWDWLNFGLEPYEAPDAVFYGATLAALAAGNLSGARASDTDQGRAGISRLRKYLRSRVTSQHAFNQAWMLLASSRLDDLLTPPEQHAIIRHLESRQRADGGWSLADLGVWRWTKAHAPFHPPGSTDNALLATADGYATGLVVYALRQAGRSVDSPGVRNGQRWLINHQAPERPNDPSWAPWRAYSLNFDREHGGAKGEPWRRMFMSDLATAFSVLALL